MKLSLSSAGVTRLSCLYMAMLVVAVGSAFATCALATTIVVDEQGHIVTNGSSQPMGVLAPDPDTGLQVLVYSLPFSGNPGEVILTDPNSSVSDYIRFPGNGTLEYYSVIKQQTTLSAATASGATNIKVKNITGYSAGDQIQIDAGATAEKDTIVAVGTAGATGTGITLAAPLTYAHASGFTGISEPLELADLDYYPFPLINETVSLPEVTGGTIWSPGISGIGGDLALPEYDFGAAITPVPASLPLFASGLAALGLLGWRKKRKAI